jgi:hypothetical protein
MRKLLGVLLVAGVATVIWALVTNVQWPAVIVGGILLIVVANELGGSPTIRRYGGADPGKEAASRHARNQGWTNL